jgi:SNF2 family DNA or RNA helicase
MEINLRPYQQEDVDFMIKHKRVLNANDPGLGKTLETLTVVNNLPEGEVLIISPKMATGVWKYEANKWYNWYSLRMTGEFNKEDRYIIRKLYEEENQRILIANSAMLEEIHQWKDTWSTIVVDEAHLLGLLNPDSETFKILCKFKSDNLFILTGTPVRKGPQDLYPMLHLLDPKRFRAYWPFVNRYCHVLQGRFGKDILNRPKDPVAFREMLSHYMVRHKKKDVLQDLPDKIRQPILLQMEGEQKRVYDELLENMMVEVGDEVIATPTILTQDLRLRQIAVCPRILGIDDDGIGLRTIASYLIPEAFSHGTPVVVATPFREAIPHIEYAIRKSNKGVEIFQIHGKIKETAQEIAQRFQDCPKTEKVLIYTIKSGASWTAHSASVGFMLGFEWSTTEQIQCEDRIHRIGQVNKVFWNYVINEQTMDEIVMDKLDEKNMAIGWVLTPKEMQAKLKEIRNRNLNAL